MARMYPAAIVVLVLMNIVTVFAQPAFEAKLPSVAARGEQKEYKNAVVVLDDSSRRATISAKNSARIEFDYDAVSKVFVEPNIRVGYSFGAALAGFAIGGGLFGGSIAAAISNPNKMDVTIYLEYKKPDGTMAPVVMSIDKEQSTAALKSIDAAFGNRVTLAGFSAVPEKADNVDLGTRHLVKGHPTERPVPELRADKALIVVACPTGTGLDAVKTDKYQKWGGYLLVNGKILALNAPGTYSFFYLDPGEYTLVSQVRSPGSAQDATGVRMKVEAGKDYYLIQTIYIAGKFKSFLGWHSKELVMYEIENLFWSDWQVPQS